MGFPTSTLSAGLVPTGPLKEMKRTKGKYVSTLGVDLVPPPKPERSLAPAAAAPAAEAVPPAPTAPQPPRRFDYFRHLREFETPARPRPPLGGGLGSDHCIFTGDRFNNAGVNEGEIRSVVTQQPLPLPTALPPRVYMANRPVYLPGDRLVTPAQPTCIFTGDDLPPPQRPSSRVVARPPETPAEVWLAARSGAERSEWPSGPSGAVLSVQLQRLREWKGRCVMPETIEGVPGFGAVGEGGRGPADAEAEAAWRIERQFREWETQTDREGARRSRERAELETANKAVSEYGERRPSRGTGDVFTPYAPRLF
jgi:hypothetical protein